MSWTLLAVACQPEPLAISGTIEARRITVAAEISGRIDAVYVVEGQAVSAGETLMRLACEGPAAQTARAAAERDAAAERLALLREGAREQELTSARAALEIAEQQLAAGRRGATRNQRDQIEAAMSGVNARLDAARATLERVENLSASGTRPGADLDAARAEVEYLEAEHARLDAQLSEARRGVRREDRAVLEQRVEQAQQQVALLEAGARPAEIRLAEAQLRGAEAAVALAEDQANRCTIVAPVDGNVDIVDYAVGEVVTPGAPLLAIGRDGPLRVRTYAPQTRLGALDVGDVVDVVVDGFGDSPVPGRILRIYDRAELTAGNVQTPEDRMLLVYRVELELTDDATEGGVPLRPGMTVVVNFDSAVPGDSAP